MDLRNNNITVSELLNNPKSKTILAKEFPDIINSPLISIGRGLTLKAVLGYAKGRYPQDKLNRVLYELQMA